MVEVCIGLHPAAYPTVHKSVGAHDVRVKLIAERSVHAAAMLVLSLTSLDGIMQGAVCLCLCVPLLLYKPLQRELLLILMARYRSALGFHLRVVVYAVSEHISQI